MKKLLLVLLTIFPVTAFALSGSGNVSNVINVGGAQGSSPGINIPMSSIPNMVTLFMGNSSTADGGFYGFSSGNSTTQGYYAVPAGKTFYAFGFYSVCGSANCPFSLGYSDTGPTSEGSTTRPLNNVLFAAANATANSPISTNVTAAVKEWHPLPMQFQAGKIPVLQMNGASTAMRVTIIGIVP